METGIRFIANIPSFFHAISMQSFSGVYEDRELLKIQQSSKFSFENELSFMVDIELY